MRAYPYTSNIRVARELALTIVTDFCKWHIRTSFPVDGDISPNDSAVKGDVVVCLALDSRNVRTHRT